MIGRWWVAVAAGIVCAGTAHAGGEAKVGKWPDLSGFVGTWTQLSPQMQIYTGCDGKPISAFELITAENRTGYHLKSFDDAGVATTWDVTGSKHEAELVQLSVRNESGDKKRIDLVVAESGEWAKLTPTEPPGQISNVGMPHGAEFMPKIPKPGLGCH